VQIPLYSLPALAEVCYLFNACDPYAQTIRPQIFINVTAYEIAYTRAPQRMKGVVFAIVLFMSAISSAITLAISPSFVDPNLIWPFVGLAAGLVVCAIIIWLCASFRDAIILDFLD
jgi:dipeptide/tripeptide permease